MNGNNLAVEEYPKVTGSNIPLSYQDLLKENADLRLENYRLHQENEKLREVFLFATTEFEKRNKKIESLKADLQQSLEENKRLREENALLRKRLEEEGKVNLLSRIAFGDKSEKREKEVIVGNKKRGAVDGHKGKGRKIPENLPIIEEIIDIPEEEKFCPTCGLPYKETGMEEESSEICIEKFYYVKKTKRKIYKKLATVLTRLLHLLSQEK